ncbi:MAG TPA: TonB-dependent receptor [Terriglobales bacterium]|nr:TonB-dependent receptor [Terriglobales bacterium]
MTNWRLQLVAGIVMFFFCFGLVAVERCHAQSETATVSGTVTDSSGAVLVGIKITIVNDDTNVSVETKTNGAGVYNIPSLRPGRYHMFVEQQGFKQVAVRDLVLNVQDVINRNFTLQVGATFETIQVTAQGTSVNTTDGAVSTVINRQFLQEIPLNGRSIQTLLALTPGVVLTEGGSTSAQGQFSVNGMRTDSNYFTVDGVAANLGTDLTGNGLPEAAAGSSPGWNAMGGTNSLVSVDAIQEFRVQTSSFAPEYGRTPGAQLGVVTRSGSNAWHGTAFEYLRNDVFNANDWFANNDHLPKAKERQNDFGGVLGGPILKDRTFFFFSYEGLRLRLPKTLQGSVPDATARSMAPVALQPLLNAFPQPNGPALGDNLAEFNATVSSPATMDAYSMRIDQSLGQKLRLFGRYAFSPSSTAITGLPMVRHVSVTTHTATVGLDETITDRSTNELRVNYSNLKSYSQQTLSTLGGAEPLTSAQLAQIYAPGVDVGTANLAFFLDDGGGYSVGPSGVSEQRQVNFTDNLSIAMGAHLLKFGADYRWLAPFQRLSHYSQFLEFTGINGDQSVLSGQVEFASVTSWNDVAVRAKNLSVYAQDTWRVNPRLTLTYGLRWDWNPAPHGPNLQSDPVVAQGVDNPSTMTVAPRGTPFYQTIWTNFAPRLGIAYRLFGSQERGTVLRGGIGEFYDVGSGSLGLYTIGFPFRASNSYFGVPYPLTPEQLAPPTVDLSARPVSELTVASPDFKPPRTYQWNLAIEQSLGQNQTFKATYLGTLGRDLLRNYTLQDPNPDFSDVVVTSNHGASNYNALQLQYQRNVSPGLQAIASYTWSHSIDNGSNDWNSYSPLPLFGNNTNIDRGSSDFDVRYSVSGALTYDIPGPSGSGFAHALASGWSVQNLIVARTAFPVDLNPFTLRQNSGPYSFKARPDIVPGQPFYLYGSQYPGGKAFNPAAFTNPAPGTQGNLGRNTLRGFGAVQDNFALHRQFNLTEHVHLQFRAEAFNVFNHPNFGDPAGFWPPTFSFFGKSSSTLAQAMSFSGLNSIYQIGGPRSLQFGLKLEF